jgi:pimeloyl-ACP methyl ester carboxylesterase
MFVIFISVVTSIVVYNVVVPSRLHETVNPANFLMLGYKEIDFFPSGKTLTGWFIPGVRNSPTIILCHGYKSNRSELLTLAATLQENGYNLFLYDSRGHGGNPFKMTTLGFQESGDLLAALRTLSSQPGVNSKRVGVWGVGMGAYVALVAAIHSEQIKAIVVDSTFESPFNYMSLQTQMISGIDSKMLKGLASFGLWLINLPTTFREKRPLLGSLESLGGKPKLFICNEQDQELNLQTHRVFEGSPFPKEIKTLKVSGTTLLYGAERKSYEILVLDFFQKNLPIRPSNHLNEPQS